MMIKQIIIMIPDAMKGYGVLRFNDPNSHLLNETIKCWKESKFSIIIMVYIGENG